MARDENILCEIQTAYGHYQVVDTKYHGRPARVLFTGDQLAAQSAVPRDDMSKMLFDYNQRFLELAIGLKPKRMLVIGGGVYTFPMKALEELPQTAIDVVEIDPELDELAEKFFNLKPDPRLKIIHADGQGYLATNRTKYDLIIIDAFIGVDIPRSLAAVETAESLRASLSRGGVVAMNIIGTYYGRRAAIIRRYLQTFTQVFPFVEIFPADNTYSLWTSQNLLLTGRLDEAVEPAAHLRFDALPPMTLQDA